MSNYFIKIKKGEAMKTIKFNYLGKQIVKAYELNQFLVCHKIPDKPWLQWVISHIVLQCLVIYDIPTRAIAKQIIELMNEKLSKNFFAVNDMEFYKHPENKELFSNIHGEIELLCGRDSLKAVIETYFKQCETKEIVSTPRSPYPVQGKITTNNLEVAFFDKITTEPKTKINCKIQGNWFTPFFIVAEYIGRTTKKIYQMRFVFPDCQDYETIIDSLPSEITACLTN